jgi:signal transduction histidine kinase
MKFSLSNFSITKQFIALIMGMGILITIASYFYTIMTLAQHEKGRFTQETFMEGKLIADFSISPLAFYDDVGATENLQILSTHKMIRQVVIFDNSGKAFARYNPQKLPSPSREQLKNGFEENHWFDKNALYYLYIPIAHNKEVLGHLYLEKNASEIFTHSLESLTALSLFSILLMVIVWILSMKMGRVLLQPILSLVQTTQLVAQERNYALRVDYQGENEIAQLYDALNLLLEETYDLTTGLEYRVQMRTHELQESLETLKEAQGQLIESEKMAALGNLVSGVAHEVNTPLGNALTGGSIILREAKLIQDSLGDGSLKRSVMDEKLGIILQSATLMIKSLTNAADLVKNFKRISVDQSIDDLRDFDLRAYLETIIQTYRNKLKHQHVEIEIISDPTVLIYSYPGSFAQIFNNFINNALLHAFEGMEEGAKITIELQHREEYLMVRFSDNGLGVDEKILPNIFEPFVTSKRNAGGTGLGMNIIYNIVTQKLKGTIHVASQINKGTAFKLRLPYLQKKVIEELLP